MLKASDILEKKGRFVASISKTQSVLEAAREMNARRIGSLVVTEGDNVVGIFTERDILTRIVSVGLDPAKTLVQEVMTTPVACCHTDTPLAECRSVMTTKRIRHVPVVDGNELKGIITSGDIMAQEKLDQQQTIEYLHQYLYSPHHPPAPPAS